LSRGNGKFIGKNLNVQAGWIDQGGL